MYEGVGVFSCFARVLASSGYFAVDIALAPVVAVDVEFCGCVASPAAAWCFEFAGVVF